MLSEPLAARIAALNLRHPTFGYRRLKALFRFSELGEQRRVVVGEADQVEEHLGISGSDDLLILVGPLAPHDPGTETNCAAARDQQDQDR